MQASNLVKARLYAPDLPWNQWDPDQLGPTVMRFVQDHEAFFRRWADMWFENFQFLFGNHSIRWSRKTGIAVDYDFLRRGSPFGMRAQTNLARVVAESLASLIYASLPQWAVEAMDESSLKGKRFRKIVQKLLDCYMERLCMDRQFQTAAMAYVVFGQFAFKTAWDRTAGRLLEIPRYQKVRAPVYTTYMAPNPYTGGLIETPVPALDSGGQQMFEERWEAVVDATGRQIIERFFAGDASVKVLTPFEYRRALGSTGQHDSKWWEDFALYDYDEFLDKFGELEGRTRHFDNVRPVFHDPTIYAMAVRHFMRMQFTTPPTIDDGFRRAQSVLKSSLFKHKVFVIEHWDCPHQKKWPTGRRVIIANGVCTHVTTPDFHTNKRDGWHPFSEAQWLSVAPSSIASGPLNDVIRKNRELDIKDSLVATAVRRNMGSQLLIKSGSGLDPQKFTGTPGEIHECSDPWGPRWLHDDMPIPPVMAQLRQADKEDVYESSGAVEALRGEPSRGASSGYQEKQREEREEKRLSSARKGFEGAVGSCGEKMVACIKQNVVELDQDVMGYLKRAAAGEFTVQDVVAFLSSNIDYGVDVKVEKASMTLKSRATMQATLMELAGGPLAQRLGMDAKVLDKFLEYFDAKVLRDASGPHRDRADRENEVFLDMMRLGPNLEGVERPVVLFEDDDILHESGHAEFFITNAEELMKNETALFEFLMHMERHRLQKEEKAAKLLPGTSLQVPAMMAAASQQPPPGVPQIYQGAMMMGAQQQQQQAPNPQAAQGQNQAPQAPRGPAGPQGGAGPQNPQAPSANSATAPSRGGTQGAA